MFEDDIEARQGDEEQPGGEPRLFLSVPTWIVLALLALVPLVFATGFSNFERARELVMGTGVAGALVAWGAMLLGRRPLSLVAGRVHVLLLALAVYALAAIGWSTVPLLGVLGALHVVSLAAVVLLIAAPAGRPLRFVDFAVAVALGAGGSGLFGLLDLAGLRVFTPIWDPPGAAGAFDAVTFATAYYVVALPIVIGAAVRFGGRLRILFGASFLLAGLHFGIVAGWSFAAIFGVVCLFTALVIAAFQRGPALLPLYPPFALVALLALMVLGGQLLFETPAEPTDATNLPRLQSVSGLTPEVMRDAQVRQSNFAIDRVEEVRTDEARNYLLGVGLELFGEQPIIGHGIESWWPMQTRQIRADDPYVSGMFEYYPAFRSPHSGPIKIGVELGLVGLLLFGLWVVGVVWITVSALTSRSERVSWLVEHWALMTSFAAGLVFMFLTPLWELKAASLVWVAAAAMLTRVSAAINDFRDWSSVWALHRTEGADPGFKRFILVGAAALVCGLFVLVPTVLNGVSSYYRGFADHLMLRTHFEDAAETYRTAHRWYPARGENPYNAALAEYRVAQLADESPDIAEALRLRPHDARVHYLASVERIRANDFVAATRHARQAVQLNPNDMDARRGLAVSLQRLNRHEEAATATLEALRRNPPAAIRANLHQRLGELYEGALERPALAIDHYQQARDLLPAGMVRTQLGERIEELDKRIQRERLIREGKPVPPELMPQDVHDHAH